MFVLLTLKERQYIPVNEEMKKTASPINPENKNTIIEIKTNVIEESIE